MKKKIFYSWQSDLPNNNNRNFIESCIKKAIKELSIENEYDIEYSIDKDTLNEEGTPHIAETIFSKIEKSSFFIADISIINSDYSKKKTPNPNVLLELGYAAKALGWNRIICIFNEDFGVYNDLPFDLKYRRPLVYSFKDKDRESVKKEVVEKIKNNIGSFNSKNESLKTAVSKYVILETGTLHEYFKRKINEILTEKSIQKKFDFINKNYTIDIWDDLEYRFENEQPYEETDIEYFISIIFIDDNYSYGEFIDRECSVFFTLKECFKQIYFNKNKVYSAYEIVSSGYSPSGLGRDYRQVSEAILKRL